MYHKDTFICKTVEYKLLHFVQYLLMQYSFEIRKFIKIYGSFLWCPIPAKNQLFIFNTTLCFQHNFLIATQLFIFNTTFYFQHNFLFSTQLFIFNTTFYFQHNFLFSTQLFIFNITFYFQHNFLFSTFFIQPQSTHVMYRGLAPFSKKVVRM